MSKCASDKRERLWNEHIWLTSVQFSSVTYVRFFGTPWTAARQDSLSITNSRSLIKLMSIVLWCHPTVSSSVISLLLPSIFPCIREFPAFSNQSLHIRWPKYLSFSFSISPSNEYSGLISWRIDWVWSPCCPRDSLESSPIPRFKSINSLALSFHYGPTLTSIHDC